MNNIVITREGIIYNERLFKFSETNEILKKVPKRVNIIIADEDILIKVYKNYENVKDLKTLINEDFFSGDGILIDNIYDDKKKELIIYGIRDNNVSIFYKNYIKGIIPIQKLVSDYLIKFKKNKNLEFLFRFNKKIYLGIIKDGNLIEGKALGSLEEEDKRKEIKEVFLEIKNKRVIIY